MSRSLLIANPCSRNGERVRSEAETVLRALGIDLVHAGPCPSPAAVNQALALYPYDRVIVSGGDGTVKCVAEALIGKNIPLGIIPAGTANNVVRTLGIPQTVQEACSVIAQGRTKSIDLARMNGVYFVSVAGIGISTKVHENVDSKKKRALGPIAYGLEAFRSLKRSRGFHFELRTEDQHVSGHAIQLTVCNGKNFGALLEVREDASVTDQQLDVLVIEKKRWLRGLFRMFFQREGLGIHRLIARQVYVRTWPRQFIDVEGDIVGYTPARFEVLPAALDVFVPEEVQKAA